MQWVYSYSFNPSQADLHGIALTAELGFGSKINAPVALFHMILKSFLYFCKGS